MKRTYTKSEKNTTKAKPKVANNFKIDLSVFKGEGTRIAFSILFGCCAIYMFISLISFFIYGGMDYHVAGKGFYVDNPDTAYLAEKKVQGLEQQLDAVLTLCKEAELSKQDVYDMIDILWED